MPWTMCAAALLRRGGVGVCGGVGRVRGGGCAPLPPLPHGRPVPRWRRCAPPPPRRAAAPLPAGGPSAARLACKPAGERAGPWRCGGAGWAGGSHPPQAPAARPPARPPLTRVCGAAAASRQYHRTALHWAAYGGHAPCVASLLKAGADASLKDEVSDGAEGRGGEAWGVGARGGGGGGGGALRRRRAASPPPPSLPPSPPGAAASTSAPHTPPPSQDGDTALDDAKSKGHTEVVKILENPAAYFAAQVGRAAPHAEPQPLLCIYRLL